MSDCDIHAHLGCPNIYNLSTKDKKLGLDCSSVQHVE